MQVFNLLFLLQLLLISIINTTFLMKLKMYNIRSLNRPQLSPQENLRSHNSIQPRHSQHLNSIPEASHVPQESQFNQLVSMFQTFLKTSEKKPQSDPKRAYEVQARDREVIIPSPETSNKIPAAQLKLWIANVVKTICSSAFNYFYKREMNYEQAKIFCSENIFKNIVTLSQTYNLSPLEMELIDNHIKKGVLTYLGTKYPLTDSTEINKKLEEAIHEIDNSQALANNYFANTNIVFEYRESGNYNDLIMLVINDLMSIIDDENSEEKSNYQDFEEFMSTSVFEKVEDEDWMRKQEKDQIFHHLKLAHQQSEATSPLHHHKQQEEGEDINKQELEDLKERLRRRNEEKEKYKNKVKQYTHYLIGRKIPENTPNFTDVEIENGNINIKSPTILRILTKWCGQLKEKYSDSYYSNRSESVKLQKGGNVNSLLAWMRKTIDSKLEVQLKDIERSMAQIFKNNYEMQSKILQNEIQTKGDEFIDPVEKISGKFSYKVVKNLHTYIIAYLNRLIHGLLKASKEFFAESNIFDYSLWPCPPNLLTFKIGDLMRCKCSSKQKEILRIYKELHRISRENPEKLKIIRVKNRLRSGTNDILMNVRFNDQITCEIQLAIKSKVSDFIKCSNLFHHYLYQLERSVFGPLSELCSIWNSLDRRTDVYHELVDQQHFAVASHDHTCVKLKKKFDMKNYDKPFVCSSCSQTYFHNNYLRHHIKCTLCAFIICAKCRINQESDTSLKNTLIDSVEIRNACKAKVSPDSLLPQMGVCVYIQSKEPKYEIFTMITYQNKKYLLGRKDDEIYEIYKINSKKKEKNFKKKFIIFQLEENTVFTKIQQKQARNKYILPVMMKQNFKKEKESFNLMDLQLTTQQCKEILSVGTKSQKENVKNLFLVDNVIEQIPFNPEEFPNVRWLTLSRNLMKSFKGLSLLRNIKIIICVSCQIAQIPQDIYEATSLEELSLPYNQISSFDERIVNLNRLSTFQLSGNQLTQVPQSLYECVSLKKLKFDNNSLTEIPDGIVKLINLEVLMYSSNQINKITEKIGELSRLREVYLAKNYGIQFIPASFSKLANIEMIDLSDIQALKEIPTPEAGWPNLKLCKIEGTIIAQLSQMHLASKKLEILIINNVFKFELPIQQYPSLKNFEARSMEWQFFPTVISNQMTNLQTLSLQCNPFSDDVILQKLPNLQNLNIKSCQIRQMPTLTCKNLKKIDISCNYFTSISNESIEELQSLEEFICTNNNLTQLPSCMIRMTNLNRLDVKENAFATLFDSETEEKIQNDHIGWPHLKYVYIANSKLEDIPLILCNSPKILDLFINQNQLKRIRPEIKNIISLKQMELTDNKITEIPNEITEFTNLTGIYLSSNQITKIPGFVQNIKTLQGFYVDYNDIKEVECFDWIENSSVGFSTLKDIAYKLKNGVDRYADYYSLGEPTVENNEENNAQNNEENNEESNEVNNQVNAQNNEENLQANQWKSEQEANKPEENVEP